MGGKGNGGRGARLYARTHARTRARTRTHTHKHTHAQTDTHTHTHTQHTCANSFLGPGSFVLPRPSSSFGLPRPSNSFVLPRHQSHLELWAPAPCSPHGEDEDGEDEDGSTEHCEEHDEGKEAGDVVDQEAMVHGDWWEAMVHAAEVVEGH